MPHAANRSERIRSCLRETAALHAELPEEQITLIAAAGEAMTKAIQAGRKIIWFGNGGSATQSQHMAAEFVGRFQRERQALPSISLTENMASVTAIGNDYAFDQIFARQLEGLAQAGDVAVGLSTSGNSPNVIRGLQAARTLHLTTIGLTGASGGQMAAICNLCIRVPSPVTARIQEAHLTIGHILCGLVDDALSPTQPNRPT
ncbi:MAG: D-sedoheptulose 7-phosphate isomerase [Candidatus Omnitrophica bacterium]|nr:D-sedoheptulose 7-phosphate isomerase [Candidatus Omnitrophota bacterium]